MKYIKTFEKLSSEVYRSAAKKLKKIGKEHSKKQSVSGGSEKGTNIHTNRANKLEEWSMIKDFKILGTFNLKPKDAEITPFYLTDVSFDEMSFFEGVIADKEDSDYGLSLMCSFYNEVMDNMLGFTVNFPIIWQKDNEESDSKFGVNFAKMSIEPGDTSLFTDRASAVKFKKFLNSNDSWIPKKLEEKDDENLNIRNNFMLHSTAEDFEEVIDSIKNININSLYA